MENNIGVVICLLQILLVSRVQTQFTVSPERACPMEDVTFTCSGPGDLLIWNLPTGDEILMYGREESLNNEITAFPFYTAKLIGVNSTFTTATLVSPAMSDITVTCSANNQSTQISEPDFIVGTRAIVFADFPGPPLNIQHLVLETSTSEEATVSLLWDRPLDTGGRDDLSYIVNISPPAEFSQAIVTTTLATFTANYSVRYTVTIHTTNGCEFNSTAVEYVFTVCSPTSVVIEPDSNTDPAVSIGAAVGITFALTAVFFTMFGILIGQLIAWLYYHCGSTSSNQPAVGKDMPVTLSIEENIELK